MVSSLHARNIHHLGNSCLKSKATQSNIYYLPPMNIKEACEVTSPLLILADSDIIGKEISECCQRIINQADKNYHYTNLILLITNILCVTNARDHV